MGGGLEAGNEGRSEQRDNHISLCIFWRINKIIVRIQIVALTLAWTFHDSPPIQKLQRIHVVHHFAFGMWLADLHL